eukprot:Nitzschia sp. Nitz4//scaffold63_size106090//3425//4724//NITZ4_004377-RA/size106090-augustus-gene-0.158-mRNA-1//1//CDS//3329555936//3459//frame0
MVGLKFITTYHEGRYIHVPVDHGGMENIFYGFSSQNETNTNYIMFSHQRIVQIASATLLLLGCTPQCLQAAPSESYSYTAYFEGNDGSNHECNGTAVMLNAHVSGDDEFTQGAKDLETSKCSIENLCYVDPFSDLCALYATNTTGITRTDITKDGKLFQCDPTNEAVAQDQCRYLEQTCKGSSLYPDCTFIHYTTSAMFENLDQIRNVNAYEDPDLALTSYMTFYSDESCSEFEGTQGVVVGDTDFLAISESLSCEEAMACIFNPDGETCINSGGLTGGSVAIRTRSPVSSRAVLCTDRTDESCVEVDANSCMKSEIVPSCWYRFSTSYLLFTQPEMFFVSTKYPILRDGTTSAPTDALASSAMVSNLLSGGVWCVVIALVMELTVLDVV